jgi:hypothetical protein
MQLCQTVKNDLICVIESCIDRQRERERDRYKVLHINQLMPNDTLYCFLTGSCFSHTMPNTFRKPFSLFAASHTFCLLKEQSAWSGTESNDEDQGCHIYLLFPGVLGRLSQEFFFVSASSMHRSNWVKIDRETPPFRHT